MPSNYFAGKSYSKGLSTLSNFKNGASSFKQYAKLSMTNSLVKNTAKSTFVNGVISESAKSFEDGICSGIASVVNEMGKTSYKNSFIKEVPRKVFKWMG